MEEQEAKQGQCQKSTGSKAEQTRQEGSADEQELFLLEAFATSTRAMSFPTSILATKPLPVPTPASIARPPRTKSGPIPTFRPTTSPTTLSPTSAVLSNNCNLSPDQRRNEIIAQLSEVSNPADLVSPTPQGQALDFLLKEDMLQICPQDRSLVQRYVLVLFYYSTEGQNWEKCSKPTNQNPAEQANAECDIVGDGSLRAGGDAWLTGVTECNWGGITCGKDAAVESLFLENNNVAGTLPYELSSLEKLKALHVEEGNTSGTIPEELGSLKSLEELDLNFNQLIGTIPESLFKMKKLIELDLNDNHYLVLLAPLWAK